LDYCPEADLIYMEKFYSIGIDFGSASARALIVDLTSGEEIASFTQVYVSGEQGILLNANDPHVARQNPADYLYSLETSVKNAVMAAKERGIDV
jgi:L-ribulokinase